MNKLKIYSFLSIFFLYTTQYSFAQQAPPKNLAPSVHPNIAVSSHSTATTNFEQCMKNYPASTEALFFVCLSALNNSNYSIEEIQFKRGTIIFKAYSREFIMIISRMDIKNSFIKILPTNNNYNFSPALLQRVFDYVDFNYKTSTQNLL